MKHEAMVCFVDEESAEQTKAMFADTDSKIKTTGSTGGLHHPYKGLLLA